MDDRRKNVEAQPRLMELSRLVERIITENPPPEGIDEEQYTRDVEAYVRGQEGKLIRKGDIRVIPGVGGAFVVQKAAKKLEALFDVEELYAEASSQEEAAEEAVAAEPQDAAEPTVTAEGVGPTEEAPKQEDAGVVSQDDSAALFYRAVDASALEGDGKVALSELVGIIAGATGKGVKEVEAAARKRFSLGQEDSSILYIAKSVGKTYLGTLTAERIAEDAAAPTVTAGGVETAAEAATEPTVTAGGVESATAPTVRPSATKPIADPEYSRPVVLKTAIIQAKKKYADQLGPEYDEPLEWYMRARLPISRTGDLETVPAGELKLLFETFKPEMLKKKETETAQRPATTSSMEFIILEDIIRNYMPWLAYDDLKTEEERDIVYEAVKSVYEGIEGAVEETGVEKCHFIRRVHRDEGIKNILSRALVYDDGGVASTIEGQEDRIYSIELEPTESKRLHQEKIGTPMAGGGPRLKTQSLDSTMAEYFSWIKSNTARGVMRKVFEDQGAFVPDKTGRERQLVDYGKIIPAQSYVLERARVYDDGSVTTSVIAGGYNFELELDPAAAEQLHQHYFNEGLKRAVVEEPAADEASTEGPTRVLTRAEALSPSADVGPERVAYNAAFIQKHFPEAGPGDKYMIKKEFEKRGGLFPSPTGEYVAAGLIDIVKKAYQDGTITASGQHEGSPGGTKRYDVAGLVRMSLAGEGLVVLDGEGKITGKKGVEVWGKFLEYCNRSGYTDIASGKVDPNAHKRIGEAAKSFAEEMRVIAEFEKGNFEIDSGGGDS
jgi:hypothetical protein